MDRERQGRVWFVTGAGRGIGRAVTDAAIAAGDRVAATVRRPAARDDLVRRHGDRVRVAMLDVRDRAAVTEAVDAAVADLGRLDVVVNNAGYGFVGTVEEASEEDVRAVVGTNFLGALWVTQAALPHLRRQGGGHVVQVSTVGGVGTMPALGLYNAGKWALEGFSEALAGEVARFGIRVTIAELGGFATDWATTSMRFADPLPAYDQLRTDLFGTPTVPWAPATPRADPEPGAGAADADDGASPDVAARAVLAHVDAASGPLRLLVGDDAPAQVALALQARRDDYGRDPRFTWPDRPVTTAG